jgi:hypothetical protein
VIRYSCPSKVKFSFNTSKVTSDSNGYTTWLSGIEREGVSEIEKDFGSAR